MNLEKIKGVVYLSAFGDAYGYLTEFLNYEDILKEKPTPKVPLVVSDDTQMSLYTLEAVKEILETFTIDEIEGSIEERFFQSSLRLIFADKYLEFYSDPDNTRAPGNTCMSALRRFSYSDRINGREGALGNNSKGCGAIMRTPWLGLLNCFSRRILSAFSILQSQTTHDHPMASSASAVLTLLINTLYNSDSQDLNLIEETDSIVEESINFNTFPYLNDSFLELKEKLKEISKREKKFKKFKLDVTKFYGEGWVADEALYTPLATVNAFRKTLSAYETIEKLVYTNGDSDSIACIGGEILGSLFGYESLEISIEDKFEPRYIEELSKAVETITALN